MKRIEVTAVTKPRTITFAEIEANWYLATWALSPAVGQYNVNHHPDGGYWIRVIHPNTRKTVFSTFEMDPAGIIVAAPRGYTTEYRGTRVTGLDDAVTKYAQVRREKYPLYALPAIVVSAIRALEAFGVTPDRRHVIGALLTYWPRYSEMRCEDIEMVLDHFKTTPTADLGDVASGRVPLPPTGGDQR